MTRSIEQLLSSVVIKAFIVQRIIFRKEQQRGAIETLSKMYYVIVLTSELT